MTPQPRTSQIVPHRLVPYRTGPYPIYALCAASLVLAWLLMPGAGWADGAAEPPPSPEPTAALQGLVSSAEDPLPEVKVYAYEIGSYRFEKALTDAAGRYLFHTLPAGVYKVIAVKEGFLPAIELLDRWSADARQRLELRLTPESTADPREGESYWTVRARIPPDVLRDMADSLVDLRTPHEQLAEGLDLLTGPGSRFAASMAAQGGTANVRDGYSAQLSSADVGLDGNVGALELGIQGRFQQLAPQRGTTAGGEMQSVALRVEAPGANELQVSSASAAMSGLRGGELMPVDLEHHQVRWSGNAGQGNRVGVSARYLEESNFYQPGYFDLAALPEASRTLDLQGYYTQELGERTSFEAGVEYRERHGNVGDGLLGDGLLEESIGVYGIADRRIQPRVVVEIGLYSEVRDGSLSLMPRGSFVIDLGGDWRARTSVSRRVDETEAAQRGFTSTFYADDNVCRRSGETCYEVFFTHGDENDESRISIGAVHRELAETLRLYFSTDFFDRLESVFMVPGDSLPELQLSIARRIAPKILARLESSFASGGGGIVYATDSHAYENAVRYLVTSLDTRFQQTATGVFIAFHHIEQALDPYGAGSESRQDGRTQVELERLQLMLTQDLSALANLSANWAVRLNMELSRGATPYTLSSDTDELFKTLTGGFSVSF